MDKKLTSYFSIFHPLFYNLLKSNFLYTDTITYFFKSKYNYNSAYKSICANLFYKIPIISIHHQYKHTFISSYILFINNKVYDLLTIVINIQFENYFYHIRMIKTVYFSTQSSLK